MATQQKASGTSWVRKMIVAGALSAVSIALFLTPFGYIPWFAGASLTVMHVPAIIGGVLEGPVVGGVIGAIFGITSLIKAATAPQGPIDVFFTNPLVSVIPRILVGIAGWLIATLLRGLNRQLGYLAAGAVGSLTNSVLVLGALVLLQAIPLQLAASVFVANSLVEAVAAAILTAGVVSAWKGIEHGRSRSRLADEA
ncbi:MAG: ECF transporter S component [Rectinemataceae bacterium]|nr:ECF transporter S component [Spirochaetaceae bacterium]